MTGIDSEARGRGVSLAATAAPRLEQESVPGARATSLSYNATIGMGFLAVAYTQVFVLPRTPPVPGMDSFIFLGGAARMLDGQAIYRDFFELTYPGTHLLYAALFKIFGIRAWVPAAAMVVVGAATAWMALLIARRIFRKESAALLAGAATLAFPVFFAPDATHRWFSSFFVLTAVWVVLRKGRGWQYIAAVLCATAAMFTQTSGLAAASAIAAWMAWQGRKQGSRRSAAIFFAGTFAATLAAFVACFVWRAEPRVFWYSTVTFVLRNYGSVWWNGPGSYFHSLPSRRLVDLPESLAFGLVHAMVPLVYVLFAVRYAREHRAHPEAPRAALWLVEMVGVALFLSVMRAPSEKRLAMTCVPALVLLVWLLFEEGRTELWARRVFYAATALVLMTGPVIRQARWYGYADTPTGKVAVRSRDMYGMLMWLGPRTHPGESSFSHPPLEFLLRLKPAAYVPYASPGDYTPPEQVAQVIDALERKQVPLIVVSAMAYLPQPNRPDHLAPLRNYIRRNYRVVKMLGGATEVWVRNGISLPD